MKNTLLLSLSLVFIPISVHATKAFTSQEVATSICKALKAQDLTLLKEHVAHVDWGHFEKLKQKQKSIIITKQQQEMLNSINCSKPSKYSGGMYKKYSYGPMNFSLKYYNSRWKYHF